MQVEETLGSSNSADCELKSLTHQMTSMLNEKAALEAENEGLRKEIDTLKKAATTKLQDQACQFDLDQLIQESISASRRLQTEVKETQQKFRVRVISSNAYNDNNQ